MITAAQMRTARALPGMDWRIPAAAARSTIPALRRMEAAHGRVRGPVNIPVKTIESLKCAAVNLIAGDRRGVHRRIDSIPPTVAA